LDQSDTTKPGASAAAIRAHYDVGNEFYRLWLDETMTYSSAMWQDERDKGSLADAQRRKIAWHLRHSEADRTETMLDIGCGWGGMLRAAATHRAEGASRLRLGVGLTLSDAQAELARGFIAQDMPSFGNPPPGFDIRVESWADHAPPEPYGAIISVGAFEHFTKPDDDSAAKIAIYRHFFSRCRDWLKPDGRMTLQSIAYGDPNVDAPAVPLHHLAGQQTAKQTKLLVGDSSASLPVEHEMPVFLGPITKPEDVAGASLADQVKHGDLFGKPNRVVERQDDDERHHQLFRACGDGTTKNQRRRQIAVGRTVMLADDRRQAAPRLRPLAHIDGGLVQLER